MTASPTPQDRSRWVMPGRPEPLGKGQFLLALYQDYIADKLTLAEIEQVFQELSNKTSHVGNRTTYKLRNEVQDPKRFHEEDIRTKDKQLICVSTQWSFENFPYVLKAAHQRFGIKLQGCRLTDKMRNSMQAAKVSFQEVEC